jgi:hypothetical protein
MFSLIIILLINQNVAAQTQTCMLSMNCQRINIFNYLTGPFFNSEDYILCKNFNTNFTLYSLNLNCIKEFQEINGTVLHPNTPKILNNHFDLSGLINMVSKSKSSTLFTEKSYQMKFKNLLGIDLNLITNLNRPKTDMIFIMSASSMNFYLDDKLIDSCDLNLTLKARSLFSSLNMFKSFYFLNVNFKQILCPYIFNEARIRELEFSGMNGHFLAPNSLKFHNIEINYTNSESIVIHTAVFQFEFYKLSSQMFNRHVFNNTKSLKLIGRILSIEQDIFKPFRSLNFLLLRIFQMKKFFHRFSIDWMHSLNSNLSVKNLSLLSPEFILKNTIKIRIEEQNIFLDFERDAFVFSDKDFCLFSNFPFDRLIVLVLDSLAIKKCSCTTLYLIKDVKYYFGNLGHADGDTLASFDLLVQFFYDFCASNSELVKKCSEEIPLKLDMCQNVTEIHAELFQDKDVGEFYADALVLRYSFSLILIPLFSLTGFLLNFLLVLVIRKRESILKDQFYMYVDMNSKFNCVYCLISMLNPINECVLNNGIYCSSIYKSYFAQYVKIILITGLGNMCKTCCNITYILILVNRCVLIGKDHSNLLIKISKIKLKKALIASSFISGILGTVKFFQYEINDDFEQLEYPFLKIQATSIIRIKNRNLALTLNVGAMMLYDFFNYVLFSILCQTIEILTFFKLKKMLNYKKKSFRRFHGMSRQEAATLMFKSDAKKQNNVILMLSLNTILNFTLRLPEIFQLLYNCLFYFFYSAKMFQVYCLQFSFCLIAIEMANFLFILTLSINFFIFYRFNSIIRKAIYEMLYEKLF